MKQNEKTSERVSLEEKVGQVWDTQDLQRDFDVIGFSAPFVVVKEKATGKRGSLQFIHSPRFYFNYLEDK